MNVKSVKMLKCQNLECNTTYNLTYYGLFSTKNFHKVIQTKSHRNIDNWLTFI